MASRKIPKSFESLDWVKLFESMGPCARAPASRSATGGGGAASRQRGFLEVREGRAAEGKPVPLRADKIRYEEIRSGDLLGDRWAFDVCNALGCAWVADRAAICRILQGTTRKYPWFRAATTTAASSTPRWASRRRGSASSSRGPSTQPR